MAFAFRRVVAALTLVGLILQLAIAELPSVTGTHPWLIELIDATPTGFTNYQTSLAVDSRGVPHVAYVLVDTDELRYAVRTPSGWAVEVVHPWHDGGWVSLKLDRSDRPHIAFYNADGPNRSMDYATKSGGLWRTETVESGVPDWRCGLYPSISIDSLDHPRIAYLCEKSVPPYAERVMYAAWNGTRWVVEQVEAYAFETALGRMNPSLAIGPDDRAHVAYFNVTGQELRHAFHDGIGWTSEVVDSGVNLSYRGTSIAVDPSNRAHIAYFDVDAGDLKYAVSDGVGWTIKVLDNGLIKGCQSSNDASLALDPSGELAVAYFACKPGVQGNLAFAWNSSSGWSTELVYTEFGSGGLPSLAFDRWGNPHISFLHHYEGKVMYATVAPSLPDYGPWDAQPASPPTVGLSRPVPLSVAVGNFGAGWNTSSTLVLFNATTPSIPFVSFEIPPLAAGNVTGPFAATWISPAVAGTYEVVASVDAGDTVPELDESNNEYTWTITVVSSPVTSLLVGSPNATLGVTYLTSLTPLSFSVIDGGGTGINRTSYRVDGGPWMSYTGAFALAGEGEHLLEWFSEDNVGNVEATRSEILRVDDTPPTAALVLGDPRYLVGGSFVTSSTPLTVTAADAGVTPVGLGTVDVRFDGGAWTAYAGAFTLPGEGTRAVEFRAADRLGNVAEASATLNVDDTPPSTVLSVGDPSLVAGETFVTSATPLALSSVDGGPVPVGVDVVEVRIDAGSWTPYVAAFQLTGEGRHTVRYRGIDRLGNVEAEGDASVVVDDSPPEVMVDIGTPRYVGPARYVTPWTPISLTATDLGAVAVGLASLEYRLDGGPWNPVLGPLTLSGPDGPRTLEYRARDRLGNSATGSLILVLDATPPTTTISPGEGRHPEGTAFVLSASDAGCGLEETLYRVDGGPWALYTVPLVLPAGEHVVEYRSTDRLGNEEATRSIRVEIGGQPPIPVSVNWKPLVAIAFSILLAVAGVWSSRRAPWQGTAGARRVSKAFLVTSLPFVTIEGATGIFSHFTGLLAIPPVLGIGTVVDVGILAAGVATAASRVIWASR